VVKLAVVANGEIWTVADAQACRAASGCTALMLGRGMVADPGLAQAISANRAQPLAWTRLHPLIADFWRLTCLHLPRDQQTGRLKQWLNLLRRTYPQAQLAFEAVRTFHNPMHVDAWLALQTSVFEFGQADTNSHQSNKSLAPR
jgi:tRNA-dihydrouridine synthase C